MFGISQRTGRVGVMPIGCDQLDKCLAMHNMDFELGT